MHHINTLDEVYQQCLQRSQTLLNKNQMILHQINKNSNNIVSSGLMKVGTAKSLYTPQNSTGNSNNNNVS